jgi:hypothetical protein
MPPAVSGHDEGFGHPGARRAIMTRCWTDRSLFRDDRPRSTLLNQIFMKPIWMLTIESLFATSMKIC